MRNAALGWNATPTSPGARAFLVRASLRREFGITYTEFSQMTSQEVTSHQAFLDGLDEAAKERERQSRK